MKPRRHPGLRGVLYSWSVLLCACALLPLAYLSLRAADAGLSELQRLVLRPRNATLALNTFALAAGIQLVTTAIALPLAWLTVRGNIPGRRTLALLGVMPLAIPTYLMAYAWLGLGGNIGLIADWTGWAMPRPSGYFGALLVLSLAAYPYLFFNLRSAMLSLDPALEESALALGHSRASTFWRVVVPQLRPAYFAGSMLIFLHVLADFAAVSLMRYETISYVIYTQYNSAFDRTYAACLALLLVAATGVVLVVEARFLRGLRLDNVGSGGLHGTGRTGSGWAAAPALGFALLVVAMGVVVPIVSMTAWGLRADLGALMPDVASALGQSLIASLPAAAFTTAAVVPLVYLSVRRPSRLTRTVERSVYLSYAVPPLALALGFVFFSLRIAPMLYQTLPLLIFAYAVHFMAEASGPVRSGLYRASPRLEEAARALGYGSVATFGRVTFPLLRNGLLVGVAFVFLSCMKELHLTFVLSPLGFNTLATEAWGMIEDAYFAEAAPFALTILLFSGLFVGVLLLQERRST